MSSRGSKKIDVLIDQIKEKNKKEALKLKRNMGIPVDETSPDKLLEGMKLKHGTLWDSSSSDELWMRRKRDFLILISTYPITSIELKVDMMERNLTNDFPPFIRRFVPEDILNKIRKGERYIYQGEQEVVEAPDPILNLATDLAIAQLIQTIKDDFYGAFGIRIVNFTTTNNVEKYGVLGKIVAALNKESSMVGRGKIVEKVLTIYGSKCKSGNEVQKELARQLGLSTIDGVRKTIIEQNQQGRHYLLLLVDENGDQNLNPWDLKSFKYIIGVGVVVFITTESAAVREGEYDVNAYDEIEIRSEDHLLPWVVFCRNAGSELVRSSSTIRRIAVKIVEECRGHLHANMLVARLLMNVQDVKIWEHTLQKLRFPNDPQVNIMEGMNRVMVNSFIIFWENLDPIKKQCLKICLSVSGIERLGVCGSELTSKWIHYGLLQTAQETDDFLEELLSYSILRRKSSFFWNGDERIQLQGEIYKTLESWNGLNSVMRSTTPNADAWHGAEIIDARLSDLPQSPNCPQLRALILKDNPDLTEIPELFFQQMHGLQTLDLSQTTLRNLPSSVIILMQLKELKLSNCKLFIDLAPEIEQLKNLEKLHLDGTRIAHLPSSPKWSRLKELFLQNNPHMTELHPSFFDHLPLLQELNLSSTNIKELPHSFSNLMELRRLFLRDCKLFVDQSPKIGKLENLEGLHLSGTQIAHLPHSPKWPRLTELFLPDNPHLTELSPLFFDHMPLLQVLNLSSTGIKELPHSFSKLVKLRSFYLRNCDLFKKLPPEIGVLKCLNHLYLGGTFLLNLPEEVKDLANLESLTLCFYGFPADIGGGKNNLQFSRSTIIPTGVISNLKSLEFLSICVNSDDKRWHENVEIILQEITGLMKIRVLELYIPRVQLLTLMSSCIHRLDIFRFIVGHQLQQRIISRAPPALAEKIEDGCKYLRFVNGVDIPQEINVALQYSDTFFLDRHVTINDLSAFGLRNLDLLHTCVLGECNQMHTIVDGSHLYHRNMLSNLELLVVFYMNNLKSIFKGVTSPCFSRLVYLALHNCPKLKTIISFNFIDNLYFLEEVVIEDCPKVSTLISHESSGQKERLFLPALRKVSLLYLPKLVTISGGLYVGPKLQKIGFYYCPKLKSLSKMELSSNDLNVIKGEARWWKRLNWSQAGWEQTQVDHLRKIFSPIDDEGDIMTQLTTDKDDKVRLDGSDAEYNNGDYDNDYDDLDDDDSDGEDDDGDE
ncbi:hypothetical protein L6164_037300 [Bauhinia variegata]|uniref:Uncharacterized protein n=1 Tax=Bauhinia variegata TaxID=167791 RepID=A0ACB9KJL5_BAUVA|nr:hypothetical protein L6164_037300 [Bauhinia variegata]